MNLEANTKNSFFTFWFKLSSFFSRSKPLRILGFPIRFLYKILFQWFMGIDIPDTTKIGKGFTIYHGQGIIIHKDTMIGDNVIVRQNTTIGNAVSGGGTPTIENNVEIGANVVIIGNIILGRGAIIAAGAVVVKDVLPYSVVGGNPAKFLKFRFSIDEILEYEKKYFLDEKKYSREELILMRKKYEQKK